MALLPQSLRSLTPVGARDDIRLRALALGLGLIPPRCMHSEADSRALARAAQGARCAVEIGVYEGASAVELAALLDAGAELHLIDPFGARPDALPGGWAGSEWATRRTVARALHARGPAAPRVRWHIGLSHEVARGFPAAPDLVFIDGDHSEAGCERDWLDWSPLVRPGGRVVFHDARLGRPDGRGLPGPTAVVERHLRGSRAEGWEIVDEDDRVVTARRSAAG
ncbi:MAG TPA: class I SAM-dependent methyltransferase [Solirubrobacteraceae bacterium]|nr:class I SAM-dependent methyltransferase [Solirubrobacteraceae bacterium]